MADDSTRPSETVQAVVPTAVADELRRRAEAERRSLSATIRIAVEDALELRRVR